MQWMLLVLMLAMPILTLCPCSYAAQTNEHACCASASSVDPLAQQWRSQEHICAFCTVVDTLSTSNDVIIDLQATSVATTMPAQQMHVAVDFAAFDRYQYPKMHPPPHVPLYLAHAVFRI